MLKTTDISSVPRLTAAIKELWTQELTPQYLWNLSDSMPKRLQMVIEAKGEAIKYRRSLTALFFLWNLPQDFV
jgi:hypothetical protein